MARPGFLNENEARAYPFAPGDRALVRADTSSFHLPDETIVDFGCMVGVDSGWTVADDVYLHALRRDGDILTFEFRATAAGLADAVLVFRRAVDDPEFAVELAEAAPADGTCGAFVPSLLWEGWLATGLLGPLADLLADGDEAVADPRAIAVEPAAVQDLSQGQLRSLSLANESRTLALTAGCVDVSLVESEAEGELAPSEDFPEPPPVNARRMVVNARCLAGDLRLVEGYNCLIAQSDRDNSITLNASLGAGAGVTCDEVPLYESESAHDDGGLLGGGPPCAAIVQTINGLAARFVRVATDVGVRVFPHPLRPHTLVVVADLQGLVACPDPSTPPAVSAATGRRVVGHAGGLVLIDSSQGEG